MKPLLEITENQRRHLLRIYSRYISTPEEENRAWILLELFEHTRTIDEIAKKARVSRRYVFYLRDRFKKEGFSAVYNTPQKNRMRILSQKELMHVKQKVLERWEYEWKTGKVAKFIWDEFKISHSSLSARKLIYKITNFIIQKNNFLSKRLPKKTLIEWQQNIDKIKTEIKCRNDTIILCEDELMLSLRIRWQCLTRAIDHPSTSLVKESVPMNRSDFFDQMLSKREEIRSGKAPASVSVTEKSRSIDKYIYGFFDLVNQKEYAFKSSTRNSKQTLSILKKVLRLFDGKKIILIWDNAKWHNSKEIQLFLKRNCINAINTPDNAPFLNPQEQIWEEAKSLISEIDFKMNFHKSVDEFIYKLNNS